MSSNAAKLNINTLETIENEFNIDDINEINTNRTVFEQETFEINEMDIGFDENFESDSEFDSFESEDNDETKEIKIDSKIQRYKNKESFRTLWQLVGVWQIDNEGVSGVNGSLEKKKYTSCIDRKYHDEDPKKNLEIIARWLFYVKNNKNIKKSQSITTSSNISHNFFIPTLLKLPTFFMVRGLTRLNQIPIYPDEKELEDDD
ncbi:hypothetical protein RhiirA4_464910 [Rhizophagus irregularis]|uniref:Uncharacterized protein n=1 Tax=Rhizophagus irregularis TaxID=588596 RepID=A0A2I1GR19_9GLOM|nr:hypothetical protein RhiirA4_464910 [Rhizophagus irregularis]